MPAHDASKWRNQLETVLRNLREERDVEMAGRLCPGLGMCYHIVHCSTLQFTNV